MTMANLETATPRPDDAAQPGDPVLAHLHAAAAAHAEREEAYTATASALASTSAELGSTRTELSATRASLDVAHAETSSARAELGVTLAELGTTRDDLDSTRAVLSTTQHQLDTSRAELDDTRRELAEARAHVDTSRADTERLTADIERQRRAAARERERAECLAAALREIHSALFSGDVYGLILRACLTISGATRGVYITSRRSDGLLRVRAVVDVDAHAGAAPPPFIAELCRTVLSENDTIVCNDLNNHPNLRNLADGAYRFRNCVAAPVVLLATLDGVIIAADKAEGDFEHDDIEALLSVGDQASVAVRNRHLERALQTAYVHTVTMLADAVEAKDPYTHGHCELASRYARLVAARMQLSDYERAVVCYAALLHDVGKIGVSDGVLNKPGPLLPEEMELMRAHVRVGYDLLRNVPALGAVADVVLRHHERYDGTGYPDGVRGEQIPMPARIVAVVDSYCAMITRRSYKDAYTEHDARAELVRCSGTQFDPSVVEAFLAVLDTPEADDHDDDTFAECGLLPGFEHFKADIAA